MESFTGSQLTGGRLGLSQGFYFSICEKSYSDFSQKMTSFAELGVGKQAYDEPVTEASAKLDSEITAAAVSVVVFAGMCLEAAIYDYAAWHLGDEYAQKHLDKLDLVSKWVVIPNIIANKELPRGRPTYERLKGLVRLRNNLVHYKSSPLPAEHEDIIKKIKELNEREEDIRRGCVRAIETIILLSLDMDFIFGDVTLNPLPSFAKPSPYRYRPPYSVEVEKLVPVCRGILSRSRRV